MAKKKQAEEHAQATGGVFGGDMAAVGEGEGEEEGGSKKRKRGGGEEAEEGSSGEEQDEF